MSVTTPSTLTTDIAVDAEATTGQSTAGVVREEEHTERDSFRDALTDIQDADIDAEKRRLEMLGEGTMPRGGAEIHNISSVASLRSRPALNLDPFVQHPLKTIARVRPYIHVLTTHREVAVGGASDVEIWWW